jgi:cytochrome P450
MDALSGQRVSGRLISGLDAIEALRSSDLIPVTTVADEFSRWPGDIPQLLKLQGSEHRRHRRAVAHPFGPARIRVWDPMLRHMFHSGMSAMGRPNHPIELSNELVWPYIEGAFATFVGIPDPANRQHMVELGRMSLDPGISLSRRRLAALRLYRATRDLVTASADGGEVQIRDAVIPTLIKSGRDLSDVIGVAMTMLSGGATLTVSGILSCLVAAGRRPSQRASVDELLLECPVVDTVERRVTKGTHIGQRYLQTGEMVSVSLMPQEHTKGLPFGAGPHTCLGASWVRAVAGVFVEEITSNFEINVTNVEERVDPPIGRGLIAVTALLHPSRM